jgi:RHS repeat-associated protein
VLRQGGLDPEALEATAKAAIKQQTTEQTAKLTIQMYHCNHLGTPIALINTQGMIDWAVELDPWGNVLNEFNPNNIDQPIRMQGQQIDRESGLFYNRHRYYDPAMGRYITQDPIGLAGGANLYSYVGGRPLLFTDRLGLAKDGAPLNAENCQSLRKIIAYEKANGKWKTLWRYNPVNFSDYSVSLDAAYQSTGGQVSIDWMMRSGVFGLTANLITGTAAYILGKELNNSIHGNNPLLNINGEANSNAPSAVSYWFHNKDVTLETMFEPALRECSCLGE